MIIVTYIYEVLYARHCINELVLITNSLVKIIPSLQVRKQKPREIKKSGHQWGRYQSPCPKQEAVPYSMLDID